MQLQEILTNPPSDLLVEIAKEITTDRMRDGELGAIISASQSREETRKVVDQLWAGTDSVAERQRKAYIRDAKTAITVLSSYLKKG